MPNDITQNERYQRELEEQQDIEREREREARFIAQIEREQEEICNIDEEVQGEDERRESEEIQDAILTSIPIYARPTRRVRPFISSGDPFASLNISGKDGLFPYLESMTKGNLEEAISRHLNYKVQVEFNEKTLKVKIYKSSTDSYTTFETFLLSKKEDFTLLNNVPIPNKYNLLVEDFETGKLNFKHRLVETHIVTDKFDFATNTLFTKIVYSSTPEFGCTAILDESGKGITVVDRENALKLGFIESYKDGFFFKTEELKQKFECPKGPEGYEAGIKNLTKDKKYNMKFGMDSVSYLITEGKRNTFGVEIETSGGYMPRNIYKYLNMKAVRDGSILGKEYVSGVLKGDSGFHHLHLICNEIAKRCTIDASCSVHVHIGDIKFTKEYVVLAYLLGMKLEKEIFSFLPPSRRGNIYCQTISKIAMSLNPHMSYNEYKIEIDRIYREIFFKIAAGDLSESYNKKYNHKRGARCGYDQSTPRYWWLNFVPAITNTRNGVPNEKGEINSYTLELRCHGGSLNFKKIKNWVKFVMAFTSFVDNNKEAIMTGPVTMDDVIKSAYPLTGNSLISYVNHRKRLFAFEENSQDFEKKDYQKSTETEICSVKQLIQEENTN